jgi:hypothetical protein
MSRPAFKEERSWQRARTLAISTLACLGRHTVTGMLASSGQQFSDWTAAYRLFADDRIELDKMQEPIIHTAEQLLPEDMPFFAAIDDTLIGKSGRKIVGASWRRDPLGPPFSTNFVWAQRFLQVACVIPESGLACRARAVPVELCHAPTPKRPGKWATEQQLAEYTNQQAASRISVVGRERLHALRGKLDAYDAGSKRLLVTAVDGAYTNNTVFRDIPERTVIIGRIRKDARLFEPPAVSGVFGRGRPRVYGKPLPTPEQIRQDESIPWQQVEAYAAGKMHCFDVKIVGPLRWKGAGDRDLKLVVVRPLGYRTSKGSRMLYRNPAYLICTDSGLDVTILLQAYIWRWEIEVVFRDQKTLIGLGEAQVRNQNSVAAVPAFISAVYAYLHLAAIRAGIRADAIPRPKWHNHHTDKRASTGQMISLLRSELWGRALGLNKSGFVHRNPPIQNPRKMPDCPASAVIYAHR